MPSLQIPSGRGKGDVKAQLEQVMKNVLTPGEMLPRQGRGGPYPFESRETLVIMDEGNLSEVAGGITLGCTHTAQSNCCSGTLCSLCC